ncbi:MAG: hypothetical protein WC277_12470 [Bacilli bacterium]
MTEESISEYLGIDDERFADLCGGAVSLLILSDGKAELIKKLDERTMPLREKLFTAYIAGGLYEGGVFE